MTEEKMRKQSRNAVVRQARSSETHQRSHHYHLYCSKGHAPGETAALVWSKTWQRLCGRKGKPAGEFFSFRSNLDLKDVPHILLSKRKNHQPSTSTEETTWRNGRVETYQGNETAELHEDRNTRRRSESIEKDSKLHKKERVQMG